MYYCIRYFMRYQLMYTWHLHIRTVTVLENTPIFQIPSADCGVSSLVDGSEKICMKISQIVHISSIK